jgi:hypothetical protein
VAKRRPKIPRNVTLGNTSLPPATNCCRKVQAGVERVCKACVDCVCQDSGGDGPGSTDRTTAGSKPAAPPSNGHFKRGPIKWK